MTTQELEELGFKKTVVPPEDNDGINSYEYYVYNMGHICLITDGEDNDKVCFFEDSNNKPLTKELITQLIKWHEEDNS